MSHYTKKTAGEQFELPRLRVKLPAQRVQLPLDQLIGDGEGLDAPLCQCELGFIAGRVFLCFKGLHRLAKLVQGGVDLALCFGPFIGIALLDSIGYRGIFSIGSAMALFNLLLVALVKVEASRRPSEHHRLSLSDFIEPRLIPFSLLGCFVCLAWGNLQAFIAGYAHEYGVVAAASSFFLVYAVAILVSRPWSGKMYDMHGPAVIMYPAFVCLVLGLVLLWANLGGWAVLLSGVFAGLGFGNFTSVGQVSAISMVPRERYAQATSTFYVFFDLGIGVAPYLGGLILPAVGYTGIFGLNAVVVVLCIGGYWLLQRAGLTHRPTATGEAVRVHD